MTAVLECRDLRKRFGDLVAVDGVSFHIDAGETYGLLGPNGAGKTTTISMVVGLLDADGGEVTLDARPLTTRTVAARAQTGYVPQELAVYPDLSGRENLRFFARLYGIRGRDAAARVDEVLGLIGLEERAGDLARHYSGGMQRRLNIGIGLLHRPHLLVLDEPTVGVDPQSRNAILESVEQLGESGMAVLYTTHYMEEAERLCDRVAIIEHGRIIDIDTPERLVARHCPERTVIVATDHPIAEERFRAIPRVEAVDCADLRFTIRGCGEDFVTEVIHCLSDNRIRVTDFRTILPTLEDVFLKLTGHSIRD
jgi:linearmycin/streptolysin S transport system ATP-binding protein